MSLEEEILDVVDANDTVKYTRTRSVVHREGLLHRAVHIFVFNAEGQLFLERWDEQDHQQDEAPGWIFDDMG